MIDYLKIKTPDVNWGNDKNNFQEQFLEEFESLPEEVKEELELVNEIATDEGMPYLIEACRKIGQEYQDLTPNDIAMELLKRDKKAFYEALNWLCIESLENYKDFKGKQPKEPNTQKYTEFEKAISLRLKELARGHKVKLEVLDKEHKIGYTLSYGDYLKNTDLFENSNFFTVKQRLAKQITFVYSSKLAKFRIKAYPLNLLNMVKELFAEMVLEDKKFFADPSKSNFFDLDRVKYLDFSNLKTNPFDNIKEVNLKYIKAQILSDPKEYIIVNCQNDLNVKVKKLGIDISLIKIIGVKIQFLFKNCGRRNSETVEITEPNTSSLNESQRGEMIKSYLKEWEILSE